MLTASVSDFIAEVKGRRTAVFVYPTETFYGIGARIDDHEAVERIQEIKGREASKGMIILVGSVSEAAGLAQMDTKSEKVLRRFWPGPLSVLLKARGTLAAALAPAGRVALRISPHPQAAAIVAALGPITSTSANRSGQPAATTVDQFLKYELDVDAILDGGATLGGQASTLVDLTGVAPVCLRPGPIDFAAVLAAWRD